MSTFDVIAMIGVGAAFFYALILLIRLYLAFCYAQCQAEFEVIDDPITVMQPILSGDPALTEILTSNLEATRLTARFIWLIDEDDIEGRRIGDRLSACFSERIKVVLCPACPLSVNPKAFKLHIGLAQIDTEWFAVLDDDTAIGPNHLPMAIGSLQRCELYTGLPQYHAVGGFWSRLLAQFVINNSVMTYLPMAQWVGPISINGMFYAMNTHWLRDRGGFESILPMLCDDYALSRYVRGQGGTIIQGVTPVRIHTTVSKANQYVAMMHRWMRFAHLLVLDQPWRIQWIMWMLLGLPPLLLTGSLLGLVGWIPLMDPARSSNVWYWCAAWSFLAAAILRAAMLGIVNRYFLGRDIGGAVGRSLLSELLQPLHLAHGMLVGTLTWRGRHIRSNRDGTFSDLHQKAPQA